MFHGLLNLPWWGDVLALLVLTQITIAGVTLYLHRCEAHRSLDLHPIVSHFFRFWMWLTTGMITKEWAAIHRKHHAKCETAEDPHSPQVYGINRVLFGGVMLYVQESHHPETMQRYGVGTPHDWIERRIYTPHHKKGILLLALVNIVLFGAVPGMLMFGVQMAWIPFWAAGVINGIGHYWGYRNFQTEDASCNIIPVAAWIGGEELHNNHHAFPTSAKFSVRWYEFDLGWLYIRALSALRLARAKKLPPKVKLDPSKLEVDAQTLQAIAINRYEVLARYAKSMKLAWNEEAARLREQKILADRAEARRLRQCITRGTVQSQAEREAVARALESSPRLATWYKMREELARTWERSTLSTEQLVQQLRDWCDRAEASGIEALAEFSQRLRRYAAA
ncbi:MAG TPA: fatty acid desaturase [Usitatibacteraceae bacterium]|nr:fatty acid desaturase [Usitatibacteraceae bacterium]